MHLVTYMNCDTVPFLLLVQYKGGLSEIAFTVTLFSNASMVFLPFSQILCISSYKRSGGCPFSSGYIEKLPYHRDAVHYSRQVREVIYI